MRTIEWEPGVVTTIDQTQLPTKTVWLKMTSCEDIAGAIRTMQMRGAPLLGAAAAFGLALTAYHSKAKTREQIIEELNSSAQLLRQTRPTAVNLFWAISRVIERAQQTEGDASAIGRVVVEEAQRIAEEDVEVNKSIGKHGSSLMKNGDTVLTHCNAGSLATVDYGTALAVIRAAWSEGKHIEVIATETRPLLQGARLTTFELSQEGIPVKLITDSMVGYAMFQGMIDKVVVGADRIVKDAVINKIGTYTIALLAHEHKIPFYVAAPRSTFDLRRTAKNAVIEDRDPEEVVNLGHVRIAPDTVSALNPAFDITPIELVTRIICEDGVLASSSLQGLSDV